MSIFNENVPFKMLSRAGREAKRKFVVLRNGD